MKTLRVSGDTTIAFDDTEATAAARVEAEALFKRLTEKGAAVFAVNRGEGVTDKRVTNFNDLEQQNLVVPRLVGG